MNVVTPSGRTTTCPGNFIGYCDGLPRIVGRADEARPSCSEIRTSRSTTPASASAGPLGRETALRFFVAYDPQVQRVRRWRSPASGFFPDKSTTQRFAANVNWQDRIPSNTLDLTGRRRSDWSRDAAGDIPGRHRVGTPDWRFANPGPLPAAHRGQEVTSVSLRGTHTMLSPRASCSRVLLSDAVAEPNVRILPATSVGTGSEPFYHRRRDRHLVRQVIWAH